MERLYAVQLGSKLINFANVAYVDLTPMSYSSPEVIIGFVGGGTVNVSGNDWKAALAGNYLPMDIAAVTR